MPEASRPAEGGLRESGVAPARPPRAAKAPERIYLIPYPKIIFLYPTLVAALVAACWLHFVEGPLERENVAAVTPSVVFLVVLTLNLVILAFDFPRTTSLTVFFLLVALLLGGWLLFVMRPELLPRLTEILHRFRPLANTTFFWTFAVVLALIMVAGRIEAQFDCWEVRPNELLHHHGIWGNLERFSAPGLRIDKEINDVFEYMLLGSGRLILHLSGERRAIILDNVPFIKKKEAAITHMLGTLQVEIQTDSSGPF
jgi:hypothetical protein